MPDRRHAKDWNGGMEHSPADYFSLETQTT